MPPEVTISGYGVFTSFGFGASALRAGVFAGKPAFAPVTRFDTSRFRAEHAATHQGSGPTPTQRDILLRCAGEALTMAGSPETSSAVVLLGTQGDHTTTNRFWKARAHGTALPSDLSYSLPAELVEALATGIGAQGRRTAFVNACIASTTAIIEGCRMIVAGQTDMAICGGAYLVDEEYFAKFDSGRAFARDGQVRPFDQRRSGLLLGDGAAVLVLESPRLARRRRATPLATIIGWGMSGDAHHGVRPHPQGAGLARAIRQALRLGAVAPESVDYINAHGTGTQLNDRAETAGVRSVFGSATAVAVSSTKSTTGHMLEGTGAVEAVISVVALQHGLLPPTVGYTQPDPECDLDCVPNRPRAARLRKVLSLNAAFGGANAALLLAAGEMDHS